jgi:hypothetical protein
MEDLSKSEAVCEIARTVRNLADGVSQAFNSASGGGGSPDWIDRLRTKRWEISFCLFHERKGRIAVSVVD